MIIGMMLEAECDIISVADARHLLFLADGHDGRRMAGACQEHDRSMAGAWQERGRSMVRA